MTKKRQYTQEFKDSAVKLVTEQGYALSEAARNSGDTLLDFYPHIMPVSSRTPVSAP
ncbi:MAG: transposase [Desulfobacterales bacterium]